MRKVVGGAGVCGDGHELGPFTVAIAGFLHQFAFCSLHGAFARFDNAGRNLIAGLAEAVAVLPFENEFAVIGQCDYIDPIGIFKYVELRVLPSVRELHAVLSDCQPRTAEQIFALENFPFSLFGYRVFHINHCFVS